MTLAAWQTSLAELVIAHAAETQTPSLTGLSDAERAWLHELTPTAGFGVTCEVQRWWREFRVQVAAPLTLSVLDAERRAALIAEYVRRHPRPSSFFLREAIPFLDLAIDLASDVAHLTSLARFEKAMLVLGEAVASGELQEDVPATGSLMPHPLADVIAFQSPPEGVLSAASRRLAMPPATGRDHWILVAPRLPNLARACTVEEAKLFLSLRETSAPVEHLHSEAFTQLWQSGALRH